MVSRRAAAQGVGLSRQLREKQKSSDLRLSERQFRNIFDHVLKEPG